MRIHEQGTKNLNPKVTTKRLDKSEYNLWNKPTVGETVRQFLWGIIGENFHWEKTRSG